MICRHCAKRVENIFLDLGFSPPSNDYLTIDDLTKPEITFPLRVFVCENCWLVQTEDFTQAEDLFRNDYTYFSSTSKFCLEHSSQFCKMIQERLSLTNENFVVEIASNDGYLLRNFVSAGVNCLGIEPTETTAIAAEKQGITVLREFFSEEIGQGLAQEGKSADLIIANNVFAHVPDINDFTLGIKALLKPDGTVTLEFANLLSLIKDNLFDTIYHEHFSYLSLTAVSSILKKAALRVYDVEELITHGGSLRVYACHESSKFSISAAVKKQLVKEEQFGLLKKQTYLSIQSNAAEIKNELLLFLIEQKCKGKVVAGYGAAAKGNTLLNYAGIKSDLLHFVCDKAESKQNKFLPGSHIPVYPSEHIRLKKPDFVLILPWNIVDEVSAQLNYVKEWGCGFVQALPTLKVF
jgi:2-polyprenyl-3-methyl-5-hydroxy-6-metoxy-1,4-benzoquinol methylase